LQTQAIEGAGNRISRAFSDGTKYAPLKYLFFLIAKARSISLVKNYQETQNWEK